MKEILEVDLPGFKAKYDVEWIETDNLSGLENVKQVYGVLFNDLGEVLIVNTVGNWQLPGGKPEHNESLLDTLVRECIEEADAEIEGVIPLGYQYVKQIDDLKEYPKICQIRFAAKIKKLNEPTIDPATDKIPERKFINVDDFLDYCPWGKIGIHIVKLAKKKVFDRQK